MGENLNPLGNIPAQTISSNKIIDHPEGDEAVLERPGVLVPSIGG